MKLWVCWFATALSLFAHAISMSSGDLKIQGTRATYQLKMPIYELPHTSGAGDRLIESIRFASEGQAAKLINSSCREDAPSGMLICDAVYEFAAPVSVLEVDCSLTGVTVPNHVHLLRATNDGKADQAMFDQSFQHSTLRFRPPTAIELAVKEIAAGMLRAVSSAAGLLFLCGLALAARSLRELLLIAAAFLVSVTATCAVFPSLGWQPAPQFLESAMALTTAYLAVEILVLPTAPARWLVAGLLGIFQGFFFAVFLQESSYSAVNVLIGVIAAELCILFLLWNIFHRIRHSQQVGAAFLGIVGTCWFVLRLITG